MLDRGDDFSSTYLKPPQSELEVLVAPESLIVSVKFTQAPEDERGECDESHECDPGPGQIAKSAGIRGERCGCDHGA